MWFKKKNVGKKEGKKKPGMHIVQGNEMSIIIKLLRELSGSTNLNKEELPIVQDNKLDIVIRLLEALNNNIVMLIDLNKNNNGVQK